MAKKTTEGKKKTASSPESVDKKKKTGPAKKRKTAKKGSTPEKRATKVKSAPAKRKTATGRKAGKKKKTTPGIRKTPEKAPPRSTRKKTSRKSQATEPVSVKATPSQDVMSVESSKFEVKPPESGIKHRFAAPSRELPIGYGDTRVVLLVRDPEWVFAYWEINDATRSFHNLLRGEHQKTLVLRVYDITDVDFDGDNAHRHYDVIVNDYAINWYLRMPELNRSWCVDLGYYDPEAGTFVTLARSNAIATPPATVSPFADEKWMQVSREQTEEILRLSGGLESMEEKGSEGIAQSLSSRIRARVESSGSSDRMSSGQVSRLPRGRDKDFRLTVNADLIIYGATEPDASVTVQGKEVELRQDGTFSIRFSLPDGTQVIPVRAVNARGDRELEIIPSVKKETR